MKLIMAPTTVGIAAAAKAMQDEGLCDKVKVSGLGLPSEMVAYTKNGCAPEFALWRFVDLGYLTYYVTYLLATGQLKGEEGETFEAGRMGDVHHREGPDPRQRPAHPDGPVHRSTTRTTSRAARPRRSTSKAKEVKAGTAADMILLPKFMGNLVFDEANQGAEEAHKELGNAGKLDLRRPDRRQLRRRPDRDRDQRTHPGRQGHHDLQQRRRPARARPPKAARDAGMTVVTWDSPIPSAEGEQVFVAQVDFDETGVVMADMALDILGADGGKFAVLSASPDAANQNAWIAAMKEALKDPKYSKLELLDVVYGNDQSEDSYNQALALVSTSTRTWS